MPSPKRKWSEKRRLQFVADWDAGLDGDALREKYAIRSPGATAHWLRIAGYKLTDRRGRMVTL